MYRRHHKRTAVQAGLLSALRLMSVQLLTVIFISVAWGLQGFNAMSSAILGGLVFIVPNVYFAYRFFASGYKRDPKRIVRAFYAGELFKILLTVVLVVGVFTLLPISLLPFITGLVGAILALWSAPRVVIT